MSFDAYRSVGHRLRSTIGFLLLVLAGLLAALGSALAWLQPPTLQLMLSFAIGPLVLAVYAALLVTGVFALLATLLARGTRHARRGRAGALTLGGAAAVVALLVTLREYGQYRRETVAVDADG